MLHVEEALKAFLTRYPSGFNDRRYIGDDKHGERQWKVNASDLWYSVLGEDEYRKLLGAGNHPEIVNRASRVEASALSMMFSMERAALWGPMRDPNAAKGFATGLFDLIYGQDSFENRFNRFSDVLDGLPHPQCKTLTWPGQTIFPFIAYPEEHLVLKPKPTQQAAKRLSFALDYDPTPNWETYCSLIQFGNELARALAVLKPRDMIDIQSFMWLIGERV